MLYSFSAYAGLNHDVTDTYCQTQTGRAYGRVFTTLEGGLQNKLDPKSTDVVWLCVILFHVVMCLGSVETDG